MAQDSLWRHPDFRRLWAGDTVSQFGMMVGGIVIPLLAVTRLAASPWQMGVLTAAETAAFLLIGLPAGVWVDRMRRRPLMLRMDFLRAALLLTVPVAGWAGVLGLTQLIVVALLVGCCTVFFDVAYQSYLPSLVGRTHLVEGNAKLQASQSVAQVTAPGVGGVLAQVVGAANAVLTTGLGFLVSAVCLLRIRATEPEPEQPHERRSMRTDIAEGLRFVFHNRLLRAIVGCTATANFFGTMVTAVLVLYLSRDLTLSEGEIGAVLAVASVGGVVGALASGAITARLGQARAIWVMPLVWSATSLLLPMGNAYFVAAGYAGLAFGAVVYNVAQVSFRQSICPDRLLGRMNASIRFVVWGLNPLGGLAGGLLGEVIGVRPTLWVAVCGTVLSSLWVLLSPLRGMRDVPTQDEAATV